MKSIETCAKFGRNVLLVCGAAVVALGASLPAQAQTGTNVALGKRADQSSRSAWSLGTTTADDAAGAVDGKKNGAFGFHTNPEPNPWWQVDLGKNCTLSEIRVFNRMDLPSRARTLQVLLSADGSNWTTVYRHNGTDFGGYRGASQAADPLRVVNEVSGKPARYVRLQLAEQTYLHLDEVEVYGTETVGTPPPDTGVAANFDGIYETEFWYIGLVRSNNSVTGYYWYDGAWYRLLTGEIKGNVLEGRWDLGVADGAFRFTMRADGTSFDAVATWNSFIEFYFTGRLWSRWSQ